jgi:hypothetical protein
MWQALGMTREAYIATLPTAPPISPTTAVPMPRPAVPPPALPPSAPEPEFTPPPPPLQMKQVTYVLTAPNGVITQIGHCPEPELPNQKTLDGRPAVRADDLDPSNPLAALAGWYVRDGVPTRRSEIAAEVTKETIQADGADECVITGLPDPCDVTLHGLTELPMTPVTGGSITLTASAPGDIHVEARADPSLITWRRTIHAV